MACGLGSPPVKESAAAPVKAKNGTRVARWSQGWWRNSRRHTGAAVAELEAVVAPWARGKPMVQRCSEPGKESMSKKMESKTHRDKKEDWRWTEDGERRRGSLRPETREMGDSGGPFDPKTQRLRRDAPWFPKHLMTGSAEGGAHQSDYTVVGVRWRQWQAHGSTRHRQAGGAGRRAACAWATPGGGEVKGEVGGAWEQLRWRGSSGQGRRRRSYSCGASRWWGRRGEVGRMVEDCGERGVTQGECQKTHRNS